MNILDKKILENYPGFVVRKDLVKYVKGNISVPSYVLEYLLGQYCSDSDEDTINSGIESVKDILRKHYVHRNESELVRSKIKETGHYKVIDKISVVLDDKVDAYLASFTNLGLNRVVVDSGTVKKNPKLLVGGVWCIVDLEYMFTDEKNASSWILSSLKPIQLSYFDLDGFIAAREQFTTEEWIDALLQSMGFNPEVFSNRNKLLQLVRLIPYCEKNYNLIELGPKGTGKSHIYSEFSPHGMLISGGEVTAAKLFVNNSNGKIGLVGYWDCVAFDEFAGKQKKVDKALVDIMKNYMANKSFSRGVDQISADASMVFVGNTQHNVPYMLKNSDLFCELPDKYYDSAFLDRLHFYIPGWEVDIIRGEMFSNGYGFVVDYLAEILRAMRDFDFSDKYKEYFTLSSQISTRDRDGINKTFSGLMKILFPNGKASKEDVELILKFAIEGRKRVKDQLMRIDSTYQDVSFYYEEKSGNKIFVKTLEELEYPDIYYKNDVETHENSACLDDNLNSKNTISLDSNESINQSQNELELQERHLSINENQKGITYDFLFKDYFRKVKSITIFDPYIRKFYQAKNLMEFMITVCNSKDEDDEVSVFLTTIEDEFSSEEQRSFLDSIAREAIKVGINFEWKFDETRTIHDRYVITSNGWKILLGRGLDIYQRTDTDAFSFANQMQKFRPCKAFDITYIKVKKE